LKSDDWHDKCKNTIEGGEKMPEKTKTGQKIVNAVLGRKTEYVRIVDWEGKSLTFILADEIRPEEKPTYLGPGEDKKEPAS
jgi:hypothetical protein